jgi:NAD(P)-dependent dehydrogenase (short-subunit alcohol dehydrogenase family)
MSETLDKPKVATGGLFDLTGKVAVVTGSTRGIGKAIVERMAEQGAKVVVSSRKSAVCDEVAQAINARHPGQAIAVPANISSKDDLQRLMDETRKAFGKIDILVCNAASNPYYGSQLDITDEAFRKILDNNIVANNWMIRMVAPEMRARKDGAIIIVSSVGGLRGSLVIGAYCISKAADMHAGRRKARLVRHASAPSRRTRRPRRRRHLPRLPRRRLDHRPDDRGGRRQHLLIGSAETLPHAQRGARATIS